MTVIYFDIETLPTTNPVAIKYIEDKCWLKHGDTVDSDKMPAVIEKAIAKTSLDGTFGTVACISTIVDDGDVITYSTAQIPGKPQESEAAVVTCFFGMMGTWKPAALIGHNIKRFDWPFLRKRDRVHWQCPPPTSQKKPPVMLDTMTEWDPDTPTSLRAIAIALGIPVPADEIDGSDVARMWQGGPPGQRKVMEKCASDVRLTREVAIRLGMVS